MAFGCHGGRVPPGVTLEPGESASVGCTFTAPEEGRFDLRLILRDLIGSEIADTA